MYSERTRVMRGLQRVVLLGLIASGCDLSLAGAGGPFPSAGGAGAPRAGSPAPIASLPATPSGVGAGGQQAPAALPGVDAGAPNAGSAGVGSADAGSVDAGRIDPGHAGAVASGAAGAGGTHVGPAGGAGGSSTASDTCSARVVSAQKPCSADPDPCGIKSGWPGDEYCLRPPPPDEGIQIHFGPKSYSDKPATDPYVLKPGQEFNDSVLAHLPLDAERHFQRVVFHARPGLHRWISMMVPKETQEGRYPDTGCGQGQTFGQGGFGGGTNLVYDNPPLGVAAPENAGIGLVLSGSSSACLGTHVYNPTDKPQLREVWVNLYFMEPSQHTQKTGGIGVIGGLSISVPPGEQKTLTYEAAFSEPGRIVSLFSDRHKWTPRLAVWLNERLVYDSREWQQQVRYNYDSITMNPPIDPAGLRDGAVSGPLPFKAGDVLTYSCFIDNKSDYVLTFKNEVEGGEMCSLWGVTVGGGLSGQF